MPVSFSITTSCQTHTSGSSMAASSIRRPPPPDSLLAPSALRHSQDRCACPRRARRGAIHLGSEEGRAQAVDGVSDLDTGVDRSRCQDGHARAQARGGARR
ncbi:hypothetical protein BC938DRAFT_473981 [Jimgerdemannia flammicorona]|uniref:Uncharacterized protein n=1 Tax=Jimgerdemannia flammicorona TaxID=994334 RepID=A0A433Q339_9FUNG|nr:hypothetical protein BC938DRAFT_473981 [Jimgerdemannia flammicorona]